MLDLRSHTGDLASCCQRAQGAVRDGDALADALADGAKASSLLEADKGRVQAMMGADMSDADSALMAELLTLNDKANACKREWATTVRAVSVRARLNVLHFDTWSSASTAGVNAPWHILSSTHACSAAILRVILWTLACTAC
jgi:hypothetical protein